MSTPLTRTVVVGCDGSSPSHRAVLAASLEAVDRDADLVVLSVAVPQDLDPKRLDQVVQRERDAVVDAEVVALRGLAQARESTPAVRAVVAVCALRSPALTALLSRCDLLVLGQRGRGGQRAFSLGSVSSPLARAATSPLMVVASDPRATSSQAQRPVVVGLDGRPASLQALGYAVTQAVRRRAPLVVVRAVVHGTGDRDAALAAAEQECAEALDRVTELPATVDVVVTAGPTAPALLAACSPTTLLVIGNRGVGRLAGPVAGSFTEALLAAAPCDVVLVPSPGPTGAGGLRDQ